METVSAKTDLWDKVLLYVENRIDEHVYDSWFRPIKFDDIDPATRRVRLRASAMTKDWVTLYYSELLEQSLRALNLFDYKIDWSIDTTERQDGIFAGEFDPEFAPEMQTAPPIAASAAAAAVAPAFAITPTTVVDIEPVENSLNPKYTFEKFVVGTSNQFAHAASLAAAETPGNR
jgi:chromosomal replication initiator protein